MRKKRNYVMPIIAAFVCIVGAAAFLVYKLGQISSQKEKWKDYDDYGWA